MKAARIALAIVALIGAAMGWLMDRETMRLPRLIGRAGWALMALAIAGLVVLPGCTAGRIARHALHDRVVR